MPTGVAFAPGESQYRDDLALTYSNFGSFCATQGKPQLAVDAYGQAIEILEQLDTADSERDRDLAVVYNNLGMTQDRLDLVAESEESFRRALALLQTSAPTRSATPMDVSRLGGVHNNLGMVLERQGRWHDAIAGYDQAIKYQSTAIEKAPQVTHFRDLLETHQANRTRAMRKRPIPARRGSE